MLTLEQINEYREAYPEDIDESDLGEAQYDIQDLCRHLEDAVREMADLKHQLERAEDMAIRATSLAIYSSPNGGLECDACEMSNGCMVVKTLKNPTTCAYEFIERAKWSTRNAPRHDKVSKL